MLMGYTSELGELLGDSTDGGPRHWTAVLTVIFYSWMDITVNVVQTPALLIVADFAGDRQTLGAAIGQASSVFGSILMTGYIELFGAAHLTLRWFLGILSVTMLVTVSIVCIVAKEKLHPCVADATLVQPLHRGQSDAEEDNASRSSKVVYDPHSRGNSVLDAFRSIYSDLCTLLRVLVIFCVIVFCIQSGFTAYNGNKGQFFDIEVFAGNATGADVCGGACSNAQSDYNHSVRVAGGLTDLLFNIVGYLYSWLLPLLVMRFGARWVITLGSLPQSLLMVMAFTREASVDAAIVIVTAITQSTIFTLFVPVVIHVFGKDADVGIYVGAMNSANCFGQLLNFAVGTALVDTSLGYALPVFVGGIFSFVAVIISAVVLRIDMRSMETS
jgi:solute carrier family 45 protein 1/2/4